MTKQEKKRKGLLPRGLASLLALAPLLLQLGSLQPALYRPPC